MRIRKFSPREIEWAENVITIENFQDEKLKCHFILHSTGNNKHLCKAKNLNNLHDENMKISFVEGSENFPLEKVSILEIIHTNLTMLPQKLGEVFVNLQELKITFSFYKVVSRKAFKSLKKLEMLIIMSCPVETIPEDAFKDLENLVMLSISATNLKHIPYDLLFSLGNLKMVFVNDNKIEEISADIFRNNPKLIILSLSRNQIKTINGDFENLTNLKALMLTKKSMHRYGN